MSGHSKWSTIKRQKGANDAAKGRLFSRLSRAISIAVKSGGGGDPDANPKLRMAIEAARSANMPKENIERAISKSSGEAANLEEVTYEGFGPEGIGIIIDTATDNRNRTSQEIKNILERAGGSMGGPGSVSFNFKPQGLLVVKKHSDSETQMLSLIDAGVEDVEETDDTFETYVPPQELYSVKTHLEEEGFEVEKAELINRPINTQLITDPKVAAKALALLESLEGHDDVQRISSNVNISDEVVESLNA